MIRCKIDNIKLQTWTYADPVTGRKFSFTLVNQDSSWNEANEVCTGRGARLVQPDSQEKIIFLTEKLRATKGFISSGAWLGVSRNSNETNQWLYTDGSEVNSTNWKSGRGILAVSISIRYIFLTN